MKRYFLSIAYKGTSYNGWQTQPTGNTIQDCLEKAFAQVYKPLKVVGSSRTDAQVHAYNQIAHIDIADNVNIMQLRYQLNAVLPKTIHVNHISPVKSGTHARFHASARTYHYYVIQENNPFILDTAYHFAQHLDITKMNQGAKMLIGTKDFQSFCKKKSAVKHHICHISQAYWQQKKQHYIFHITANRFLHGMVRTIVSTLIELSIGKYSYQELQKIINAKNRCLASPALPPHGLFLTKVHYPTTCYMDPQATHQSDEKQTPAELLHIFQ